MQPDLALKLTMISRPDGSAVPLSPNMNWTDQLAAAEGYLEAGLPIEANNEIDKMSALDKCRPEVYGLKLEIYAARKVGSRQALCGCPCDDFG